LEGTHSLKNKNTNHCGQLQSHRTMAYTPQNNNTPQSTLSIIAQSPKMYPGCTASPYLLLIVIVFAILFGYPDAYTCYWLA
jgi:hypothetical protein